MINAGTEELSVPPATGPIGEGRPRRRRRAWVVAGVLAALMVAAGIAAAVVQVPYYALSPGSVWSTEELIAVEEGVETFDSEGEIGFTTVSLRRATALEAFLGWLDPAVKVVEEEVILGDQTPDQNRQLNRQFMTNSKVTATAVAFEALGEDVVLGDGAVVMEVAPGMPADGLLEVGDVIIGVDGDEVELWEDLVDLIGEMHPGDRIELEVERAATGEVEVVEAELAPREEDPELPILGVIGQTRAEFDFPYEVEIDSGDVGGPSAGLAFTLAILDVLTPEDLTGGRSVATTGTIDLGGHVGPVGGVPQKTVAARRAGVELFIVPSVEAEEAREYAGDMEIAAADTLEEALEVLDDFGGDSLALADDWRATG